MTNSQMASHFARINEGGYIRTTPTQSPRSSQSFTSRYTKAQAVPSSENTFLDKSTPFVEAGSSSSEEPCEHNQPIIPNLTAPLAHTTELKVEQKKSRRAKHASQQPPILNKSGTGSDRSSKSAPILPSTPNELPLAVQAKDEGDVAIDDEPTPTNLTLPLPKSSAAGKRSISTRFNEEVSVSTPKASTSVAKAVGERKRRSSGDSGLKSGKRNPVVVASSGTSRRRPAVMRQKSSQVSSAFASKDVPSRSSSNQDLVRSSRPSSTETAKMTKRSAEAASPRQARTASLHPSKQQRKSLSSHSPQGEEISIDFIPKNQRPKESSHGKPQPERIESSKPPLVDPDFRAKFANKTRSFQSTHTNVPAFARKSSAALPTADSYHATGMIGIGQATGPADKGKGKEAFINEIVPLKAPAAAGREVSHRDIRTLPTTKSQLTLLLEREKARSANQDQAAKKPAAG